MNYADLAEEHKVVTKQLQDADKRLAANMQIIESLNRDKERKQKELNELEAAARALDPTISGRTLLERLRDAPHSITSYAAGTATVALAHVLVPSSHISYSWI
jgi:hypothetical protein